MRYLGPSIALFLSTLIPPTALAAATPAATEKEAGVLFYTEDGDAHLPAPVVSTLVHLRVTGIVARGRVHQIFYNPTDEWLEGIYVFPLPENAAVDGLRLVVGERVLVGRIAEKAEAEEIYDEARSDGRRASLLNQERPDLFVAAVANVGPGEEVEVVLDFQQEVRSDGGRFHLRLPLLAAERYRPPPAAEGAANDDRPLPSPPRATVDGGALNPVALRVDLEPGFPIEHLGSPTHELVVRQRDADRFVLELADELTPADGDFVLEWQPQPAAAPRAVLLVRRVGGEHYALLMVLPPATAPAVRPPREVIFVIDTSGSMEGASLAQAQRALAVALDDLEPSDRFNVIRFSDAAEPLFPEAVPADPRTIDGARGWIDALEAEGGTNMLPALTAALATDGGFASLRQVVFVTDGQVSNEADLFAYVRQHLGGSRLFTVGIGSAPNGHFMRRAASYGRGTYTFISSPETVEREMNDLLAKLAAPVLTDLSVQWDDPVAEAWPERVRDLYLGEPLVVCARLSQRPGTVRVDGWRAGEPWHAEVAFAGSDLGGDEPSGLDKLWARRKVDALMWLLVSGAETPEEIGRQVADLGLRHQLVTAYTSLVAVDHTPGNPGHTEPARRMVPLLSPRGGDPGGILEQLVVTSQVSLMSRSTTAFASGYESLPEIPAPAEPWSTVARVVGVDAGRVDVAAGRVDAPRLLGPGADADQNVLRLDGFEIQDEVSGEPAFELGGTPLQEISTRTAGADVDTPTPGLAVDLTARRGDNMWRGAVRIAGTEDALSGGADADENRLTRLVGSQVELGGPFRRDRLWFQGSFSRSAFDRAAIGGQETGSDLEHAGGRIDAQHGVTSSVRTWWHGGGGREEGFGAGPDRAPAATWDHRSEADGVRVVGDHLPTSNTYLSAAFGRLERELDDLPLGELDRSPRIDRRGVTTSATFARHQAATTDDWQVSGRYFARLAAADSEFEFGAHRRRRSSVGVWQPAGSRAVEHGGNLAAAGGRDVAALWLDTAERNAVELDGAWLRHELGVGRLQLVTGLRYQGQRVASQGLTDAVPDAGAAAGQWLPRLALTAALSDDERTVLRAGWGRFAARLGALLAARLEGEPLTGYPAAELAFVDGAGTHEPWYGVRPDAFAADLAPELTDEATVAVERRFNDDFEVGLSVVYRRRSDVVERRTLVRGADGRVFQARAEDWIAAGEVVGTLPGGAPYRVPFFDLRPGLEVLPSGLLVNGDRRHEYLGIRLSWYRRGFGRWRWNGHLSWNDQQWRLGPEFRRFDDPTDVVGSGDDNGDRVAGRVARDVLGLDLPAVDARWTLHFGGSVDLPAKLALGWAVSGRDGHPLPYLRRVARATAGVAAVELTEAADALRLPAVVTVDARLGREVELGGLRLGWTVEVFNLLDAGGAVRRELDLGVGRGGSVDETVSPRTLRLGVSLSWQ